MINVETVVLRSSNYASKIKIKCIKVERFSKIVLFNVNVISMKYLTKSGKAEHWKLHQLQATFSLCSFNNPQSSSTFIYVHYDDIHDGILEEDSSSHWAGIPRECDCRKNWKCRETAAAQVRGFRGTDIRYRTEVRESEMQGSSTKNHRARIVQGGRGEARKGRV